MSETAESGETCRIDVWLWRARIFKTRSLAAEFVESGRLRRTRAGVEQRLDKASRSVRPGDVLVFALGGRIWTMRVMAVGDRRGPPQEARALYTSLETASAQDGSATSARACPGHDSHQARGLSSSHLDLLLKP
jgi:ribosome-associated heat shock protein Hsp15